MGYLGLLRRRKVLALWVAQTLSVLGDRLYALAVMWLVWTMSGSAWLVGLVAVVESVPYVVVGACGRGLIARCTSLPQLAWVDLARAMVVAAVPLAVHAGAGAAALIVAAAVLGCLGAVFDPSFGALVPTLVERERVQQVCGLLDLTGRLARVGGPASAGLLLLVVPELHLYLIDAVTFVVSAAALWWLARRAGVARTAADTESEEGAPPGRVGSGAGSVAAWPLLRRHPQLGVVIGLHGLGLFSATVAAVGMPIVLTSRLGAGAGAYALVLMATGIGALAMNPVAANVRALTRFPDGYCLAWAVNGLALAGLGLATSLPTLLLCAAIGGACGPVSAIAFSSHLAQRYSVQERGRLLAVDHSVIRACGTAGMLTLPALVAASPRLAFSAAGAATVLAALTGLALTARQAEDRQARRTPELTHLVVGADEVLDGPPALTGIRG